MSTFTIDYKFFNNSENQYFATLQNLSITDVEGRILRLYKHCFENSSPIVSRKDISIAMLLNSRTIIKDLVESGIISKAEKNGFYSVEGLQKRIDIKIKRSTIGAKGGLKKKNSKWIPKNDDFIFVTDLWNQEISPQINRAKVQKLGDKRKRLVMRMFNSFPNDRESWKMIMREALETEWIRSGRYTFNFESFFEKERFLNFYDVAIAKRDKDIKTENEIIDSAIPKMDSVIPTEELWDIN